MGIEQNSSERGSLKYAKSILLRGIIKHKHPLPEPEQNKFFVYPTFH